MLINVVYQFNINQITPVRNIIMRLAKICILDQVALTPAVKVLRSNSQDENKHNYITIILIVTSRLMLFLVGWL